MDCEPVMDSPSQKTEVAETLSIDEADIEKSVTMSKEGGYTKISVYNASGALLGAVSRDSDSDDFEAV